MSKGSAQGIVPASPAEVLTLASDPAAFARVVKPGAKVLVDERMADGTRRAGFESYLSSDTTTASTVSVLEAIEDERVVCHVESGAPGRKASSSGERIVSVEAHPHGSLVTVENDWRFKSIFMRALLGFMLSKAQRRLSEAELGALQRHFGIDGSSE